MNNKQSEFEDALEAAYWNYDARIHGYNRSSPQEERDAFKAAIRMMFDKLKSDEVPA